MLCSTGSNLLWLKMHTHGWFGWSFATIPRVPARVHSWYTTRPHVQLTGRLRGWSWVWWQWTSIPYATINIGGRRERCGGHSTHAQKTARVKHKQPSAYKIQVLNNAHKNNSWAKLLHRVLFYTPIKANGFLLFSFWTKFCCLLYYFCLRVRKYLYFIWICFSTLCSELYVYDEYFQDWWSAAAFT